MNDDAIKSLLRTSAPAIDLRPADAFWGEAARMASAASRQPALPRRSPLRRFAPFGATAAAAAAALVAAAVWPGAHAPALNDFRIGSELPNNGAVLITDSDTDATILWVITEET